MTTTLARVFLLTGALLVAGCAGNATAPSMFVLDTGQASEPSTPAAAPVVVVDDVDVARYLDEGSIVYQTAPHRVVLANNNRWASPLATQLTDGLRAALTHTVRDASIHGPRRNAPADALHLVTQVDEFMGHYDGYAHIAGQWQLMDASGQRVAGRRFEQRIALRDDGYDALVGSLSRGWQKTARDLGQALSATLAQR